jgi:hypothetical protein
VLLGSPRIAVVVLDGDRRRRLLHVRVLIGAVGLVASARRIGGAR